MIIDIIQAQDGMEQLFDVFYDNIPKYSGKLGRFSALETFSLRNRTQKINLTGAFALPSPLDMVPMIYIFGRPKILHFCYCQNGMRRLGTIGCYEVGIRKAHHRIIDASGRKFHAYHFSDGGYEYLPIYLDDVTQVAVIEATPLTAEGSRSRYKLYILDDYRDCADIFSMYVMYFANWYDTKRLRSKPKKNTVDKKSAVSYIDKFDREWLAKNFPKTDPEEDSEIR